MEARTVGERTPRRKGSDGASRRCGHARIAVPCPPRTPCGPPRGLVMLRGARSRCPGGAAWFGGHRITRSRLPHRGSGFVGRARVRIRAGGGSRSCHAEQDDGTPGTGAVQAACGAELSTAHALYRGREPGKRHAGARCGHGSPFMRDTRAGQRPTRSVVDEGRAASLTESAGRCLRQVRAARGWCEDDLRAGSHGKRE